MKRLLHFSFSLDLPYDGTIKRRPCLAQGKFLTSYQISPHSNLGLLSLHSDEWQMSIIGGTKSMAVCSTHPPYDTVSHPNNQPLVRETYKSVNLKNSWGPQVVCILSAVYKIVEIKCRPNANVIPFHRRQFESLEKTLWKSVIHKTAENSRGQMLKHATQTLPSGFMACLFSPMGKCLSPTWGDSGLFQHLKVAGAQYWSHGYKGSALSNLCQSFYVEFS